MINIIAHRGFCAKYPENTWKAIEAAIDECGVEGVEFDVHLTQDNQLILQHDDTLDRMTTGSGRVCDAPWSGGIDGLKTKHSDLPVSLFADVLQSLVQKCASLPQKFILVIDVKDDQDISVLDALAHQIRLLLPTNHNLSLHIGTWTDEFTRHARAVMPEGVHFTWIGEEFTLERVGCDLYDSFNVEIDRLSLLVRQAAKEVGKAVFVWTCNSQQQIALARAFAVDSILLDDPRSMK